MESSENKNQIERRAFLKKSGMAVAGVGLTAGLPTHISKAAEKDALGVLIGRLDEDEQVFLGNLLGKLAECKVRFDKEVCSACLSGICLVLESAPEDAEEEEARQKEQKHRDSLTGQRKIDYFVEQLTDKVRLCLYNPHFIREVLELVAEGEPSQPGWKESKESDVYLVGELNSFFEGTTKNFKLRVIKQYLESVQPALLSKYDEEQAEQEACDEFLALTTDKTVEQIREMTACLTRA